MSDLSKITRDFARGSIVTQALARLIRQVIEEINASHIAPRDEMIRTLCIEMERLASHSGLSLTKGGGHAIERALEATARARALIDPQPSSDAG